MKCSYYSAKTCFLLIDRFKKYILKCYCIYTSSLKKKFQKLQYNKAVLCNFNFTRLYRNLGTFEAWINELFMCINRFFLIFKYSHWKYHYQQIIQFECLIHLFIGRNFTISFQKYAYIILHYIYIHISYRKFLYETQC
jgi:hypothetical protein